MTKSRKRRSRRRVSRKRVSRKRVSRKRVSRRRVSRKRVSRRRVSRKRVSHSRVQRSARVLRTRKQRSVLNRRRNIEYKMESYPWDLLPSYQGPSANYRLIDAVFNNDINALRQALIDGANINYNPWTMERQH